MNLNAFPLLFLVLSLSFSGCVTRLPYTPPTSGKTAYLRVIAKDSADYFAWTKHISNTCSQESPNFPTLGAEDQTDTVTVGFPDSSTPNWDHFERVIPSDQAFKISVYTLKRVSFGDGIFVFAPGGAETIRSKAWSCHVEASFVPKQSTYYEMIYDFSPEKCNIAVNEISNQGQPIARSPVQTTVQQSTCEQYL